MKRATSTEEQTVSEHVNGKLGIFVNRNNGIASFRKNSEITRPAVFFGIRDRDGPASEKTSLTGRGFFGSAPDGPERVFEEDFFGRFFGKRGKAT
jgi:hypothetical protein